MLRQFLVTRPSSLAVLGGMLVLVPVFLRVLPAALSLIRCQFWALC
jgi:hypothetical protein